MKVQQTGKTKVPTNFRLDEFIVSSNVQFWCLTRHRCLYQRAVKSEGTYLAQTFSNAPTYKLHVSFVALEMLIRNNKPATQLTFMDYIVLKYILSKIKALHWPCKTKQEINSYQKSSLGFERGTTSPKNPTMARTKFEFGHLCVRQPPPPPPRPTKLRGVWRENKSLRVLDFKIKWRWVVDITLRPSVPQQRIIALIN
jgi:hypothetical protein